MEKVSKIRSISSVSIVILVGVLCVLFISSSLFAYNGSVTLSHGVSGTSTLGKITSTATESSMKINMTLKVDGYQTAIVSTGTKSNVASVQVSADCAGLKGSSFCNYYVGGASAGQSSAWWNFDFR